MASLSIENTNGGIPAQLQLLILHCLSAALNQTQKNSNAFGITDNINNKQLITVSVDKDIFDKDMEEKLRHLENKLLNKVQDLKSSVIEEVKRSSCKSEELFPELIRNISNISSKNQALLVNSIQENGYLSKRNEELQSKLEILTQNSQGLQKTLMEENNRLSNSNDHLQVILGNLTIVNRDLEGKIEELQDKMFNQTENIKELELEIKDKDFSIQELKKQLTEATKNIHNLNESLHTLTEKYSNLTDRLGISDLPVNFCKIQQNSVFWRLVHKDTQSQTTSGGTVWKPSLSEQRMGKMQLQYSSGQDKYFRAVDKQELRGWENGVYRQNQFFRMVENDWKVAYLVRKVLAPEASISWKFDVSDNGRSIDNVRVIFTRALFLNGVVEVSICSAGDCTPIPKGNGVFETRNFQGMSQFQIVAKTSSGTAGAPWHHAQLFRQLLNDTITYGFDVTITFRKCDVTLL